MRNCALLLFLFIPNLAEPINPDGDNGWAKFRDDKHDLPKGAGTFSINAYLDHFKIRAIDMTIKDRRKFRDEEKDNIEFGFDMLRNATKAILDMTPAAKGNEVVNITGLMFNKNVIDAARERQPRDKRRQFDKDMSREGQKSRISIAKNLIDNGKAVNERKYDTPNMKLFIHRAKKEGLTDKYLNGSMGSGSFKLSSGMVLEGNVTAVVHQLRKGDGHWGREANKYQIKSNVIGMQLLRDNGTAIEIKGLANNKRISMRFPDVGSNIDGVCVWWDIEKGEWSSVGCTRTIPPPEDGRGAECKCDHLTEFAIAEAVPEANATGTTTAPPSDSGWSSGEIAGLVVGGGTAAVLVAKASFDPKWAAF